MTSAPRLRRGMMLLVGAFGFALALSYAWVLPRLVLDAEDRIFGQQFATLRDQWSEAEPGAERLFAPGVRAVEDLSQEPPTLAAFLADLPPGVHEFNDDPIPGLAGTELLIAVEAPTEQRPKRWLLYDVTGMEALEGPWRAEYVFAVGGGLLLALVATLVGLIAGRRVFVALDDLEQLLAEGPPPLGVLSAAERRDDEVGRIARRWRETDSRLRAALEREQRFTRDASHELRTPIAAARGALELLRGESSPSPARRAEWIGRMDAALMEMGDLVDAFLWLAREPTAEREGLDREEFDVGTVAERLLRQRATALRSGVSVQLERSGDGLVEGSERLAMVVLGNLLGNAILHGTGAVRVTADGTRVSIRNSVSGPSELRRTQGFGYGQAICSDLCRRFGWRLDSSQRGGDFCATVDFAPGAERPESAPAGEPTGLGRKDPAD